MATPVCPECDSSSTHYVKGKAYWRCNDCDESFAGPPPESVSTATQRIFLSYGHDDNTPLVEALKKRLHDAGHEPWIDQEKIQGSDDWRRSITDGIIKSDRVLAFLSKHSVRDPGVCLDEIGIALSHRHGAIATLLVEPEQDIQAPPTVAHIQYLNLSDWREQQAQGEAAWNAWLDREAGKILDIIARNTGFAGEMDELEKLLRPLPQGGRIGTLVEREFIGRAWLLDEIEAWRASGKERARLLLAGPGMGKSTIAAHLAHTARLHAVAYHFCRFDEPSTRGAREFVCSLAFQLGARLPGYRALLLHAARYAGKPLDQFSADDLFTRLLAEPLRYAIDGGQRNDRLLALIDALDEAPEIAELLARRQGDLPAWLALVVTSRPDGNVLAAFAGMPQIRIDADDPRNLSDVETYLDAWFCRLTPVPEVACREILLERSEGNILYIVMARAGVDQGIFSLADPTAFPNGLGGIYRQWFLRQFGADPAGQACWPACYALLELVCASPEPLPLAIARRTLGWQGQDRVKALGPLGSLVREDDGCIEFFHRSMAEWLRDPMLAERFWINAEDGAIRLGAALWSSVPDMLVASAPGYPHRILPTLLLGLPAERRGEVWGVDDARFDRFAALEKAMAPFQDLRIRHARLDLARLAVDECRRRFGDEGRRTLEVMNTFSTLLHDVAADFAAASSLKERVYKSCERVFGTDDRNTLVAMNNLARSVYAMGDWAGALVLQEKVLAASERVLGADDPDTLMAMNNLAANLAANGDRARALVLQEKILAASESIWGGNDPRTLSAMENLAWSYFQHHNLAAALYSVMRDRTPWRDLQEKVLTIRERDLGTDHPDTLRAKLNSIRYMTGDRTRLQEELLEAFERVLGAEHPDTLTAMGNLAGCLLGKGDLHGARALQEKVLVASERVRGIGHPDTLFAARNLKRYQKLSRWPWRVLFSSLLRWSVREQ